ncbi:hypothetical protein [Flavobacterium notoginsengisoli]
MKYARKVSGIFGKVINTKNTIFNNYQHVNLSTKSIHFWLSTVVN